MKKSLYEKYADIREKLAIIELAESALKAEILEEMKKSGLDKHETEVGKFIICSKKKWSYSKKVLKIEEDLKVQKFTEQEKGIAKVEETSYLAFTPPKE